MKRRYGLFFLCLSLGAGAAPAWANQPPGPLVAMPELLLLPLMMLFTAMGGGYVVLRRLEKTKHGCLKAISAVILIFVSAIHAGLAAVVCVFFGLIAVIRGLVMMTWGITAGSAETIPPHLEGVKPAGLIISGFFMIVIVVFLTGMALSFAYHTSIPAHRIEQKLERRVAQEIARARIIKMETGELRFQTRPNPDKENKNHLEYGHLHNAIVEYANDRKGFTMYVLPYTPYGKFNRFPFFPYHYLTAYPSYCADETGQIRMVYTRHKHERCPADAPVVRIINEDEIEQAMAAIQIEQSN